jgi:hypothetical protein
MNISVSSGYERIKCYPKSELFALLNALGSSTSSKSLSTFSIGIAFR